ncbi:MAG: DUF5009 domain-containing protein [Pirellulales bacterium]|nr:DUF5009 domain-containing protein [Pirellulales bacterium]
MNRSTPSIADLTKPTVAARLVSLDAYRGFIMLMMAAETFGFPQVAKEKAFANRSVWQFLGYQFDHVQWVGCAFWDLIQPAFMFLVGLSMAYSYASRQAKGQSYRRMLRHAISRSAVLVLLGIFLYSQLDLKTNCLLKNVLTQIGLGYVFLFLLWNRPWRVQAAVAATILVGYWGLFACYPLSAAGFDDSLVGLPKDWPHLAGFAAHWDKGTNAAAAFDRWFLNLAAWNARHEYDGGGYQTLSFIPSLATMIFGLQSGGLLRSEMSARKKVRWLIGWGFAGLASGWLLAAAGLCPMVKRIWTPTFALYSAGWVLLMLAAFYGMVDGWGKKRWCWPLVIVGMNSIAIYLMDQLLRSKIERTLSILFGPKVFNLFGYLDQVYSPIIRQMLVVLCLWMVCFWMYRQKLFLKI